MVFSLFFWQMGAVNPRHPSGGAACGNLFGFIAAFASAISMSRHNAAIRFRLTAIAVNFAWKLTLRLPQPRARFIPWKSFISPFFHSCAARFLYFSRNSGVPCAAYPIT